MKIPPPGAHGGDGAVIAHALGIDPADVLDLSQSLNPMAPDPVPVVERHLHALVRYPDPTEATTVLARAMGVAPEWLLLTNGGAEGIALVAAELGGRVVEPEFGLYPRGVGPLWRSNPHSPVGLLAGPDDVAGVWDEAFYPLATGHWTRGDAERGAVVLGSLTKLFACPGLRLGYVLADPERLSRFRARQPAWSVGGLASAALPDLLEATDLAAWADGMRALRAELVDVLHSHGLHTRPSEANWVLVDQGGLREALAPYAIVVRDCANFGMPNVTRISVPMAAGLERLDTALTTIADKMPPSKRQPS